MKTLFKRLAVLLVCQIWGISAFYLFPYSIMLSKSGDLLALIPVTLISLSCAVNEKICHVFSLTTNFPHMRSVPISLSLQIIIYLIIGVLILLAKPRKKKPVPDSSKPL